MEASADSGGSPDSGAPRSPRGCLDEGHAHASDTAAQADTFAGERSRSLRREVDGTSGVKSCEQLANRPIATPCRSRVPVHGVSQEVVVSFGQGNEGNSAVNALLWKSGTRHDALAERRRTDTSVAGESSDSQDTCHAPLGVAGLSTLLDLAVKQGAAGVLGSVLQVWDSALEEWQRAPVVELCIARHLPPPTYDLTRPSIPIQKSLSDVVALLQPWKVELRSQLPAGLLLHEATSQALLGAVQGHMWGAVPERVVLFTDGSFDGRLSGWSFVVIGLVGEAVVALQWAAAPVVIDHHHEDWVGASEHGSQQAEASAFCLASLWALQCHRRAIDGLISDSLTTIKRACGEWHFPLSDLLATTCRSVAQSLEVMEILPTGRIAHVSAHKGCPWNELADGLAKWAVAHGSPTFEAGLRIGGWIQDASLPHLWLLLAAWKAPELWPQHSGGALIDEGISTTFCVDGAASWCGISSHTQAQQGDAGRSAWLHMVCVSVNVQTLGEGHADQDAFLGRTQYLRDQLAHLGVSVAGLQETRSKRDECVLSGSFIRLCSGCSTSGQYGVEAWFARRLGDSSDAAVSFLPEELTVVHWEPRMLCVRVFHRKIRFMVVVLHAPTAQDKERVTWWQHCRAVMARTAQGMATLVLGDFNTRFSHALHSRVGELVWPDKSVVPTPVLDILRHHDLWVPATFASCHWGPHETWFPPGGGRGSRIDYVAIPTHWTVPEHGSYVLEGLDFGQTSVDHFGVCLHVMCRAAGPANIVQGHLRLDQARMATPEGRLAVQRICQEAPLLPWSMDSHTHFQLLSQHVRDRLEAEFPAVKRRRAQSFLTDATWVLRGQRAWLRKQVAQLRRRLHAEAWPAFVAWRQGRGLRKARLMTTAWLVGAARHASGHVEALRNTKKELRVSLRNDRLAWLHDVARQASDMSVKDVVQRLRPLLGPPKSRSRVVSGLPAVAKLDGTLVQDPDEMRERWIEHFAANEGGRRCSTTELAARCQDRQRLQRLDVPDMDLKELPTRNMLEASLRDSAPMKAIGPDGLPAELLRFGAGSVALPVYQLLLKTVLRLEEPLAFKGGMVHHLWKGKGAPHLCQSHRAILISSSVGKAVHRTIRGLGIAPFLRSHSPLQVGGLPRHPVLIAAHAARLFASAHCRGNGFLVFLDLREAFYRVARPLLVDMGQAAEDVARVFAALRMPPESLQAFRRALAGDSALQASGASAWMQRVFRELLSDTWFRLPSQRDVVVTDLGTRPGDCLADLMFSFLFATVLCQVKQSLQSEGFDLTIPWSEAMRGNVCPDSVPAADDVVHMADCAWMDDMCLMVATDNAQEVFPKLSFAAGVLIDTCIGHGMMPNLDRGKSEAIVLVNGPGSRAVRRRFLSDLEPTVAVEARLWPQARLRITPTYRHLGGLVTHRSKLVREVRSRIGFAWAAFNKHKKQVFASPLVPIADKVAIFNSVVVSVLLYGAGAWTCVDSAVERLLQTAYVAMARVMLSKHLEPQSRRVSGEHVLALLGLPDVYTLLHAGRLSYLASFVSLDIQCLWAMAHAERHWLQAVAASVHWLWEEVDGGAVYSSWQCAWQEWCRDIPRRPRWWKRRIRFAKESSCRRQCVEEAWQHYRGLVLRRMMAAGATLPGVAEDSRLPCEVCVPCCRKFDSKQAWAVHAFKVHGRTRPERSLVEGVSCPICLRTFASNVRLCRHVQHSGACRGQLRARGFVAEVGPGVGNRKTRHDEDCLAPVMQGYGPLQEPVRDVAGEAAFEWPEHCTHTLALLRCLAISERPGWRLADILEEARSALGSRCLSSQNLVHTVEVWRAEVPQLTDGVCSIHWGAIVCRCAEWLCENLSISWLCQQTIEEQEQTVLTFVHSEAALSWLDFAWVETRAVGPRRSSGGLLLCHEGWRRHFSDEGAQWDICLASEAALSDSAWYNKAKEYVDHGSAGTVYLCLYGLHWKAVHITAPLRAKPAKLALQHISILRDVIDLCLSLWATGHPFVTVLPVLPQAFLPALLSLPGVEGFRSEAWQVLHNVPEEEVPEFLFHHI